MRIIHTADLHLGQVLYQSYERADEHTHFFRQLEKWCREYQPDALTVSGDIFDTQQPSSAVKAAFTDHFVKLHEACRSMQIVLTAGNHDSAARLQADSAVWAYAGVHIAGTPPSSDTDEPGWQDRFIIDTGSGYIVSLPYMTGNRASRIQAILDRVQELNIDGKPVVMMAHAAVTGADLTGHGSEIGTIKTQDLSEMGTGWDYLALGHIHKPQTIGHAPDSYVNAEVTLHSPVARYSGSALHVSCDETYPHSVSLVDIDRHGGDVTIRPLRIDELRHFHILPETGAFSDADDAIAAVKEFAEGKGGYFRLRLTYSTPLPSNFSQSIYDALGSNEDNARFNPKIIWEGVPEKDNAEDASSPTFAVADLQQMTDPVQFIEKTIDQYPGLDMDDMRSAFDLIRAKVLEIRNNEGKAVTRKKAKTNEDKD